jgi:hypothetical protein
VVTETRLQTFSEMFCFDDSKIQEYLESELLSVPYFTGKKVWINSDILR